MAEYAPGFVPDPPQKATYAEGFVPDEAPSVGSAIVQAVKNRGAEAMAAPGKVLDAAGSALTTVKDVVTTPPWSRDPRIDDAIRATQPKPSVALPLSLPGGGTMLSRLLGIGAGKMLEEPADTYAGNLTQAAKGVFGDPDKPLSMVTSPAAVETAVPLLSWLYRITPGAKARINEGQSQELLGTIGQTNRVARDAIEAAPVSALQKEPRTAAAIKRGFESGAVADAASQRFDAVLDRVASAAGNPALNTPALQEAYRMMPALEQRLLGPVGPNGFSLQQAQKIRSWVGDPAFAQSTLGQGVRKAPQQQLWGEITQEMEGALAHAPRARQLWQANNRAYGSTQAFQDSLTERNAFTNQPNRTFLNRSALSDYFARNEVDLVRRMGRDGFDFFVERVLGGAQPGTRDILASGAGTATDALAQVYGRGQGGAPQIIGSLIRTGAPSIGSQYTGRAPYTLPAPLQAILDVALQKAGGAALSGDRR